MLSNLKEEIRQAAEGQYIIPGFNVFGVDEAMAVVRACEREQCPTLLMINRVAAEQYSLEYWSSILLPVAREAKVPVSLHLDHCSDMDEIRHAVDCGYTSVMYDGSHLPLEENIRNTQILAKYCAEHGVTLEGEVGCVPYDDRPNHSAAALTDPAELKRYAEESGSDWIAVAVGQIHRLGEGHANVNFPLVETLAQVAGRPLVIHGGSSILPGELNALCGYSVGKINVGTKLRRVLFQNLREEIVQHPKEYDRFTLFHKPLLAVEEATVETVQSLRLQKP